MTTHSIAYRGLKHVVLAAMHKDYIQTVAEHANNMEVLEGVLLRPPVSLEAELAWYDGLAKRKDAGTDDIFAILMREQEGAEYDFVGTTGIHRITWPHAHASTGSLILRMDHLKREYGTEAKLLLQYHAFRVKGLHKLTSSVKAFNGRSLGHLIKCGYRICGRHKQHFFHDGGRVDEILLEVFREDWEPIWEQYQKSKELPKLTDEQRVLVKTETEQ